MGRKRLCETALEAVADVADGASILVQSFGPPQAWPTDLLLASGRQVRSDGHLQLARGRPDVAADPGRAPPDPAPDLYVCDAPDHPNADRRADPRGEIEAEMVPRGARRRVRAAAPAAAFYTPGGQHAVAAGRKRGVWHALCARDRPARRLQLVAGVSGDAAGSLTYRRGGRSFGPAFATAATATIAEVKRSCPSVRSIRKR